MKPTDPEGRFDALLRRFQDDPRSVERMSAGELLDFVGEDLEEIREQRRQPPARGLDTLGEAFARARLPVPLRDLPWDGRRGAFRPQSVAHVQQAVRAALDLGVRIRAMGSRHSTVDHIDGHPARDLHLLLDGELRDVEFLEEGIEGGVPFARVRVGGGCYLGPNPSDPSQPEERTLTRQLDAKGYALPITGGITHQSVAGFLQTGSAGGSLRHGMADCVEALELVDGQGDVRTFQKGTDAFAAAGIAMGLFGIVTHVTLKVGPAFWVEGTEQVHALRDSWLARDASGHAPLAEALQEHEYLHLNWFPQRYVQRVMQWRGQRVPPGSGPRKPYEAAVRGTLLSVAAAAMLKLSEQLRRLGPNSDLVHRFIGVLMSPFVEVGEAQAFRDAGFIALPTDNGVDVDRILRILFTEVWLPLEETDRVLGLLEELLKDQEAAGNFAVELYAAKASPFWLSPACEGPVVRVDPYWWACNEGRPQDFFGRYWERLLDVPGARFHWGKYLPELDRMYGHTRFDLDYLRRVHPRLEDWLRLRAELDPRGVFLNDYWQRLFELEPAVEPPPWPWTSRRQAPSAAP